jgi:hypothetical protein
MPPKKRKTNKKIKGKKAPEEISEEERLEELGIFSDGEDESWRNYT